MVEYVVFQKIFLIYRADEEKCRGLVREDWLERGLVGEDLVERTYSSRERTCSGFERGLGLREDLFRRGLIPERTCSKGDLFGF